MTPRDKAAVMAEYEAKVLYYVMEGNDRGRRRRNGNGAKDALRIYRKAARGGPDAVAGGADDGGLVDVAGANKAVVGCRERSKLAPVSVHGPNGRSGGGPSSRDIARTWCQRRLHNVRSTEESQKMSVHRSSLSRRIPRWGSVS